MTDHEHQVHIKEDVQNEHCDKHNIILIEQEIKKLETRLGILRKQIDEYGGEDFDYVDRLRDKYYEMYDSYNMKMYYFECHNCNVTIIDKNSNEINRNIICNLCNNIIGKM
jgi:hypothetical protein